MWQREFLEDKLDDVTDLSYETAFASSFLEKDFAGACILYDVCTEDDGQLNMVRALIYSTKVRICHRPFFNW